MEQPADPIARLAHASVLVIGDAMLDRYVHGSLRADRPEAAPVLTEDRELALPGGAANVVRQLTGLGAAVAFIAVVGDDPSGSDLTGLVGGQPNVEPWLLVEGGRTTTVKTRYLAAGRPLLRADREQTHPIPERLAERVLRIARDAMAATSLTVLSDYGKGVLAPPLPARLIAAAREAARPVVAALPRGASAAALAAYAGADAVLLCATEPVSDPVAAAAALRGAHGFGLVLLGDPAGLTLVDGTGAWQAARPEGADGTVPTDAVLACLAAALAVKLPPAVALRLAAAGAASVTGAGAAAAVRPEALRAALEELA
ncbi:MAG: bifunctional heptose 7-phosphate kinase/heptose 1-phosphate adenyltransferase [Acetobacteraceae bacterium]